MSLWVVLVIAVVLAAVVALLAAPLRDRRASGEAGHEPGAPDLGAGPPPAARADLEAAREAKYREIRDAELDFRTGKLSEEDYRAIDATLRAEAIEILRRLDEVE